MFRRTAIQSAFTALAVVASASGQGLSHIDFRPIVVTTPTALPAVTTLPTSIAAVRVGETYYVELWVSDVGSDPAGVACAFVDLLWPWHRATAVSIEQGGIYNLFAEPVTMMFGEANELGACTVTYEATVRPGWARLALVEFTAAAAGSVTYALELPQDVATPVAAASRGGSP